MKKFLKQISKRTWAFIVLFALFFAVGISTLGSVRTTGESVALERSRTAYFSLTVADGEKLDSVYVKVDNYFAADGEDLVLTLNTINASAPAAASFSSSNAVKTTVVHADGNEAAEYAKTQNWIALGKDLNRDVKTISFQASVSLELEEIVCFNQNGERIAIKGYKPSSGTGLLSVEKLAPAYDAQKSFKASESAYYNFTAEESYYLNAVKNVMAGSKYVDGGRYVVNNNFNYLATVLFVPSVAIFGESVFAMRLPAFLATCATLVFAYLLASLFFKDEKYAFIFAALLCVGGLFTTVGRMAAPYALIASALTASAYFMYRFFAKGISSERIYKDGLNILFSGIFAAFAMVMDTAAIFPVLGILALFGFGLRRQKLAYEIALKKTVGKEESITNEQGETIVVNKAEKRVKIKYEEKQRASWCYALLSFVMASLVLLLISAVICYTAVIRANGNQNIGFIAVVLKGAWRSLRSVGAMPFGEANQTNVWAWWLPIKAATIYKGVNGVEVGQYLAWNVTPNLVVCGLSFLAVIGVTIKVAMDIAKGKKDKNDLRLRRRYFILLGGLAAAMLGGCLKVCVTPMFSMFFQIVYTAFLPLAATMVCEEALSKTKKLWFEIAKWAVVGVSAVFFAFTVPSMYGIVISDGYARLLRFICLINNGYIRSLR